LERTALPLSRIGCSVQAEYAVILDEEGTEGVYEFTELFIADDYKGKGHAAETVEVILNHFKQKGAKAVRMQVNKENVLIFLLLGGKDLHEVEGKII